MRFLDCLAFLYNVVRNTNSDFNMYNRTVTYKYSPLIRATTAIDLLHQCTYTSGSIREFQDVSSAEARRSARARVCLVVLRALFLYAVRCAARLHRASAKGALDIL